VFTRAKTVYSPGTRPGEPCALCGGPTIRAKTFAAWKCLACGVFCPGMIDDSLAVPANRIANFTMEEYRALVAEARAENPHWGRSPSGSAPVDLHNRVDLVRMAIKQGHRVTRCACGGPVVHSKVKAKTSRCLACNRTTGSKRATSDERQPFRGPWTMTLEQRLARYDDTGKNQRPACQNCGEALPLTLRKGSKYCSRRGQNRAFRKRAA
jgi:hypothetical protein